MAVDLVGYTSMEEHVAVQEAASAGLRAMEHLVLQLSSSTPSSSSSQHYSNPNRALDCGEITDFTVSKFRKVISMLDRTGHARFRRGPTASTSSSTSTSSIPLHDLNSAPPPFEPTATKNDNSTNSTPTPSLSASFTGSFSTTQPLSSNNSSHRSSITGEGSVTGKLAPPILSTPLPAAKPPKCPQGHTNHTHNSAVAIAGKVPGVRCHCSKKRKLRMKKTIRVPAISPKIADIPSDEYSWRKYGQKPIKGSPFPRNYYKCSTVKGCPAKKHVEKDPNDPSTLIVTYEDEHRHPPPATTRSFFPTAEIPLPGNTLTF